MTNQYRRGRIAEKKVVNDLKDKEFENIRRSKGSRRHADIDMKYKKCETCNRTISGISDNTLVINVSLHKKWHLLNK